MLYSTCGLNPVIVDFVTPINYNTTKFFKFTTHCILIQPHNVTTVSGHISREKIYAKAIALVYCMNFSLDYTCIFAKTVKAG